MTNQEKYISREARMQTFRWATPGGLAVLTIVVGLIGWLLIDEVGQMRTSILDLKTDEISHYTSLWGANTSVRSKVECIQSQLAKCCKDSVYCT